LDRVPARDASILGKGDRLADLNDYAKKHPADGSTVIVTGVSVLALDEFDETHDGSSAGNIYVQDLPDPHTGVTPPYGGVTLYNSSFSPPTLRIGAGDVVDVRGVYEEFPGPSSSKFECVEPDPNNPPDGCLRYASLPEIVGGTVSLRFESKVLEPQTIPLSELGSYDTGRKWIGMLVRVENVTAHSDGYPSKGRYSVRLDLAGVTDPKKLPTINNALLDLEATGIPFQQGTTYKSVTGVVQYFYNFAISPRSPADLEL
jgi:hypothetical protein